MKSLYKRKLLLIILFLLIIFRTINLLYYNSPKSVSKGRSQRILSIEYAANIASITFQKLQFEFEHGANLHMNGILSIFSTWKFILAALFVLKALLIDRRKLIITLITRYFEGSKYKDSFSFSQ
jgi:hypothetical protein